MIAAAYALVRRDVGRAGAVGAGAPAERGAQGGGPRIGPRRDRHDRPPGPDRRLQPGRRADVRPHAGRGRRQGDGRPDHARASTASAHRKGLAHYLATGEGPLLGKRIEVKALRGRRRRVPRRAGDLGDRPGRRAAVHRVPPRPLRAAAVGRGRCGSATARSAAISQGLFITDPSPVGRADRLRQRGVRADHRVRARRGARPRHPVPPRARRPTRTPLDELRSAYRAGRECLIELRAYRKDGDAVLVRAGGLAGARPVGPGHALRRRPDRRHRPEGGRGRPPPQRGAVPLADRRDGVDRLDHVGLGRVRRRPAALGRVHRPDARAVRRTTAGSTRSTPTTAATPPRPGRRPSQARDQVRVRAPPPPPRRRVPPDGRPRRPRARTPTARSASGSASTTTSPSSARPRRPWSTPRRPPRPPAGPRARSWPT